MPLITTIPEVKKYLAIDGNTNIATIAPFIDEAELLFILPLLGQAFYDELIADYDPVLANMTEDNQLVMPYIQRAEAYYMAFLSVEQIGISFGDMGIQQMRGDNSEPAPLWKVGNLKFTYIKSADIHAEKLLEFLELNATVIKYNNWYASAANTRNEGYMVYSTIIASQYVDINDSRLLFLRMKKRIIDIEANSVSKIICQDQYDELVAQIKTDSITATNQKLIDKIRPFVSKYALYLTLPSVRVTVSAQGLTLFSSTDGFTRREIAPFIRKDELKSLMDSLKVDPFGYEHDEKELRQFFLDNIDDYPLIKASDCYTIATVPGPTWQPSNSADNKHFSI